MKAVQPHVPFSLDPLPVNFLIGVKLISHFEKLELNKGKETSHSSGVYFVSFTHTHIYIQYMMLYSIMYFRVITMSIWTRVPLAGAKW